MPRCLSRLLLLALAPLSTVALAQTATSWLAADRLFHRDPLWLGADAAFSIDLGHGRVLWNFGDTFVARHPGDNRAHAAFVRNTVALQTGYDPTTASIRFFWRGPANSPSEFFPSEPHAWLWPSSGIRLGNALLLFCTRLIADRDPHSLGFQGAGWVAFLVPNPDDDPSAWTLHRVAEDHGDIVLASAALRLGDFVYLLADRGNQHDLFLARLPAGDAARGDFHRLLWSSGPNWVAQSSAAPIIHNAGSESSLQPDPRGSGFLEINSQGFGATDIVMRRAPRLEGPWSPPQKLFRPPESNAPHAFVYAGKSHPELTGADLILTYAANSPDDSVWRDTTLYFPRFVRVTLPSSEVAPVVK
jgi:hypothetical protein